MVEEKQNDEEKLSVLQILLGLFGIILIVSWVWGFFVGDESGSNSNQVIQTTRCLDVPLAVQERLNNSLNIDGGGSIRNLQAVKSNDFTSVYFISGDLQGAGLEGNNDIATFVMNKLDTSGLTLSADAVSTEFSDWPNISTTNLGVTTGDDGYSKSRECVSNS